MTSHPLRPRAPSRIVVAACALVGACPALAQDSQPAPSAASQPAATQPRPTPWEEWRAPFDGPIATDRPDFTETSSVVPRGRFQLEGGYTFTYDSGGGAATNDHTFPELLLRVGVATGWELRIGWEGFSFTETAFSAGGRGGWRHEHDDGGTDMNVGFKARILEQAGWIPDFSLIGELSLPTGASGKTSGDVDPGVKLLWGYELSDRLSLAGNVNFAAVSDDQGRFFQSAASVSLGYALTDWLGTYVEYFAFFPNGRDSDCANYLDGGFTFRVTENLQFDLRAGFGLNGEADDFFTGAGFAVRF